MAVTAEPSAGQRQLAWLQAQGKLDEGLRYEVLFGELVIRGRPGLAHEKAVRALASIFVRWVERHGGEAFTGLGVEMGGHQLAPDVAFIGPERVAELDEDGFHVPPDLVVEVTSPGTRSLDLTEKAAIYAELGVAEYWVVDLAQRRIVVHRRDAAGAYAATAHTDGVLTTAVAPGLQAPVAAVL